MDVRFVAGFAVIATDPARDKALFVESLGLPLRPPVSVPESEYVYSEEVAGAKHFGVWPLNEAAPRLPPGASGANRALAAGRCSVPGC